MTIKQTFDVSVEPQLERENTLTKVSKKANIYEGVRASHELDYLSICQVVLVHHAPHDGGGMRQWLYLKNLII